MPRIPIGQVSPYDIATRSAEAESGVKAQRIADAQRARGPPEPPRGPLRAAYSIEEFCKAHRISELKYYALKNLGLGPVEMQVGRRRLVSIEAAEAWRRAREAA